ncbi:MAG: RluA family pseudouridine synthase, partial [Planctomycetes bacterium]|nr:RluA family pseudouridine synthase [Planctomycetota bacterium]
PAGRRVHGTLIHWLHTHYRRPEDAAHDVVPRLLHRLDRETSGLVMASLDPDVHSKVAWQFEQRTVQKVYHAVVHGAPPEPEGVVDLPIAPDSRSSIRLKLRASRSGEGLPAVTGWRVLRSNARFSLVELRPRTGRTHQLRVHMDALGCPLVGDKIYGVDDSVFLAYLADELDDAARARLILDRHALHSASLTFHHPVEQCPVTLRAPLPADMDALVCLDRPADSSGDE